MEVTAIDSRTILISWFPPPLDQQNGIIREYHIIINEGESGETFQLTTAATSVTVPSLHPFYTYNCTIAAFTVGEGPHSGDITLTMPEDGTALIIHDLTKLHYGAFGCDELQIRYI